MHRMQPHRPAGLLVAWLAYAAFVVYGSLVPLDFQPRPWDEAWRLFQHIRLLDVGAQGRADWIANGVLYLPLAFLTAQVLAGSRQRPSPLALVTALIICLTLAVTVEFVQLFFPPRTVSLNDLLAEGIGSLLGVGLAAAWGGRFRRLLADLASAPNQLALRLLEAYAVAYIAFSLFPFDFLVSVREIAEKAQSGAWGWLFAPDAWHGSLGLTLAKLSGEALAALPLGYLAHRLRPRPEHWPAAGALAAGALLGLIIETAQFFIVSGVSQGLSLITRALGFHAGVVLGRRAGSLHPSRIAAIARRHTVAAGVLYFLALATVNGWFERRWMGMEHAARTLAELRFLPFYYHYYTTEQAALLSLTAVGLMYTPIGLLTWTTWSPPALALLLALLAAGLMEASKLFLDGLRPDPTNVLLAGLAAWATAHLARRLSVAARMSHTPTAPIRAADEKTGQAGAGHSPQLDKPAPFSISPLRSPSRQGLVLAVAGLAAAAWGVATFPFQPFLLGLLLGGYAMLIWRHPQAIWFVLPAALPLLDLAPLSGRFLCDEFDLLLLVTLSVGYARVPPVSHRAVPDPLLRMTLILLVLTYAVGLARGLPPLQWPDLNAFSHYYSGFNALRVAKGAVWAFLLLGLLRRLQALQPDWGLRLAQGMVLGLAGTVAVVLWERLAFPGLANFADVYRVTGPFSQMHTGGADLETHLTLSLPFLLYLMFTWRGWLTRAAGSVLLMAATYAMMVTFARIGYAAYALAMLLTLSLLLRARARHAGRLPHRSAIAVAALGAMAVAVAWPIWHGPFSQERMARSGADLELRLKHWQAALAMRDPGLTTAAFGMGLGRYPQTHAFRSQGERAATHRLEREANNVFLRLGSGSPLYVEQFVAIRPGQDYLLSLDLRSAEPGAALSVSLCEKWLLTSARCRFLRLDAPLAGAWVHLDTLMASGDVGNTPWYAPRPVKLSLFNAEAGKVVEVDRVSLETADGRELVSNGDFSSGMDRWFFSVDNDLPWHIWSLPVSLLFDLGWLGLAAHALFFALALARSGRAAWRGDPLAGALFAAVAGYLALGSMDSLMDSPRMLLAGLLLAWLAARCDRDVRSRPEVALALPAQGQLE
ncbi:MAG: VanZ family protein [Thiobacillaceae bacterium]